MPQGDRGLVRGALSCRRIPCRHVGANRCRASRIDPGAEPLVDELERRLEGGATGGDPTEDLADRLDGLRGGLDRQLQPGAAARLAQPSPSFSSNPPPCDVASPVSAAYASSSSRAFLERCVGTTTSTSTWRSPLDPRRRCGTPRPRSLISVSGWVPA